jgi:hypothetical protein
VLAIAVTSDSITSVMVVLNAALLAWLHARRPK